jgi:hypothetical protein
MNAFDDPYDCYYLATNFTIPELQTQIAQARINIATSDHFPDTFPWCDLIPAYQEAITWLKEVTSKPAPVPVRGHIDTEAIKARNDIVAVIGQYTPLKKAGRNFKGLCPIHGDKNPSLAVYPDQQTFHCFGCQRGGDVISFIQEMENTDFRGAVALLGGR